MALNDDGMGVYLASYSLYITYVRYIDYTHNWPGRDGGERDVSTMDICEYDVYHLTYPF